ncbi:hypothetical protein K490DRAFT_63677 [Saccharata proteae CBS 121410]|uniref:Exocyst complex component Sec3 PIP2-binding N-terminal domain-containing protein n=1 Tax=Saccharata proteae CBS 121410 TaxID=1314787 RepID=A0A6A5YCV3_9PEZI|nr:hypothetical protein K490DRAFT_63677 [Saccharata proteae CBS 121410]
MNGPPPGAAPSGRPSQDGQLSRAERYEDEKRRIIESCFSKMDPNGALSESYITHLRVTEDAGYPQTPPPPDSPAAGRKPRVIIIAVRSSGRVRMHKGRENANGSFSIGKTWNLEDLSAVESFANSAPTTPEEAQRKQWAGPTGFIVTIAKPYFWSANSPKEKDFFINSLIKIYSKYTSGKTPQLIGFSSKETDQMLRLPGGARNAPPSRGSDNSPGRSPNKAPQSSLPGVSPEPLSASRGPPPSRGGRPGTAGDDRPPPSRGGPPQGPMPGIPPNRDPSRQPRPRPSQERERDLRQPPSRDQMRPRPSREHIPPLITQSSSLSASSHLSPQSSHADMSQQPAGPAETPVVSPKPPVIPPQSPGRPRPQPSEQPTGDGVAAASGASLFHSTMDKWKPAGSLDTKRDQSPHSLRPPTAQSNSSTVSSTNVEALHTAAEKPPERKRPPMLAPQSRGPSGHDGPRYDDIPAPLRSPRAPPMPSAAEANTSGQQIPGAFFPSDTSLPAPEITPEPTSPVVEAARELKQPFSPEQPAKTEPVHAPGETVPESSVPIEAKKEDAAEASKPGLGPMIRKKDRSNSNKDMANILRKAATAYGAFKPRAGGAGEKFLASKQGQEAKEQEGITGVFVAPSLRRQESENEKVEKPETPISVPEEQALVTPIEREAEPSIATPPVSTPELPELKVSEIKPAGPPPEQVNIDTAMEKERSSSPDVLARPMDGIRNQRSRSNQQNMHLSALGIDPGVLQGRGIEFESMLSEFGWGNSGESRKKVEELEADIKREIARVEAGSWLGHLEQKDDRIEAVRNMLDEVISEADKADGLLTLYGVELGTLTDDVAYIEAQGQGLQVQIANQKLLQKELQTLVDTLSIDARQLAPLRKASIGNTEGLEAIEPALLLLYKAMITIDPAIRQGSSANTTFEGAPMGTSGIGNSELSNMRAVREKREYYLSESAAFLDRLKQQLDMTFGAALLNAKDAINRRGPSTKLDPAVHDLARNALWRYSPLLLFAKEIDMGTWDQLLRIYQLRARSVYQDEFRENVFAWRKMARNPGGEEQELLFTSQEKDAETLSHLSMARKLTVKRSQTLAGKLRGTGADKAEKQGGRLYAYEAFSGALDQMCPLVFAEQNFIVDFFHATSAENIDFADAVREAPPEGRRGTNLQARKLFDPDRTMAKRVVEAMEETFTFWPNELSSLVDWVVKMDPLQGIGLLSVFDRTLLNLEETNQDYLTRTIQALRTRLTGLFSRFVDTQIAAIEETKVKIKKRKGVIAFIKTFPHFSSAIENMLPPNEPGYERLEVRQMVDDAYARINKAMFESLRVIAKESPGPGAMHGAPGVSSNDPEDKEALNYHILHIENMNHYIEEVDERGDVVLREWKENARRSLEEHLGMYVDAVIRRSLGKLLDVLKPIQDQFTNLPLGTAPATIAPRSSKPYFRKVAAAYDGKEMRRGIHALRKRVEKHFGDADDPDLSRGLVIKVLAECERKFHDTWALEKRIGAEVFNGEVDVGNWGDVIAVSFKQAEKDWS